MQVPEKPRVISYMDAQWFLRASKFAFDVQLPNINPRKLTEAVAAAHGWETTAVRTYIEVPESRESPFWSRLWTWRIQDLETLGVNVKHTMQRTRTAFSMDGGVPHKVNVRSDLDTVLHLSLDAVTDVLLNNADVVLLFTSENKYLETTEYLKALSRKNDKYLKIMSAFPYNAERPTCRFAGIDRTDWFPIDWSIYSNCTDFIRKPKLARKPTEDETTTDADLDFSNIDRRDDRDNDSRQEDDFDSAAE